MRISALNIRDLDHSRPAFSLPPCGQFFGKSFHVYMMASKPRGVIYVGMSSDLIKRATEHREHLVDGFTKRYWVDRLVYFEAHDTAGSAQRREYLLKRWRRDWKIALIETMNPTWADLFSDLLLSQGLEP